MRDMIGNKIVEGSCLYWKSKDALCWVTHVSDGGIAIASNDNSQSPATMKAEVKFTIPRDPKSPASAEVQLHDFVCILDPNQQAAVEKLMKGKPQ